MPTYKEVLTSMVERYNNGDDKIKLYPVNYYLHENNTYAISIVVKEQCLRINPKVVVKDGEDAEEVACKEMIEVIFSTHINSLNKNFKFRPNS